MSGLSSIGENITHQVRLHLVNDSSQGSLSPLSSVTSRATIGLEDQLLVQWRSPSCFVSFSPGVFKWIDWWCIHFFLWRLFQRFTARCEKKWCRKSQQLCFFISLQLWPLVVPLSILVKKRVQETAVKPLISLKISSRSALLQVVYF